MLKMKKKFIHGDELEMNLFKNQKADRGPFLMSLSLDSPLNGDDVLLDSEVDSVRKLLIAKRKVEEPHYSSFLIKILPIPLNTLHNANDTGKLRILCTDTLAIWCLRSTQLITKSSSFKDEVQSTLDQARLDYIFGFIIDYWDETGAPLSNSLKDLFSKLIALQKNYESDALFVSWMDKTLLINRERRVRYYLIETLSKEISDPKHIIQKDPSFIPQSLEMISSNSLGNPVGKALCSVYKRLYTTEEESLTWIESYWGPINKALENVKLRAGVEQHLLPHLFKLSKTAFKTTVTKFQNDTELFITCLNIGQQLALEDEIISQILSKDLIESLLTQESYKVKMFQLLTFSPKGSKPISPITFEILKKYLELFLIDTEVETRNEFISLFKQFLYRLKDSSYGLNRDADKLSKSKFADEAIPKYELVKQSQDFLKWLIQFLKTQMRPGSQYQRVISSLKILRQLVESNLDPELSYNVKINYPFSLKIFDDEYVDLLFGNLLSTYDDIRDEASVLLLASKIEFDSKRKENIINTGFKMLNDYGKSDSGAKLLQLSYNIFKDYSIYERLIQDIPLIDNISEAVNRPIDGYFNAITLVMKSVKNSTYSDEEILSIIEKNWLIVKEILTNDSPEGCDQYGVGSAQLVLSYGWRATKESTLLVQEILNHKLSDRTLLRIGDLTMDQLSTVRHRGAFSSVYPTFMKVVSVCHEQLPGQAKIWMDHNLSLIQTKTQLITRRSGGLPYLITAIVSVENDLFVYAFEKLLEIAKIPVNESDESEKMDLPQIHAFNCIKTLFIESQLSGLCSPFVYRALELSLSTFSSNIWSVRNCSIMLFTALQNRLFGKKRMSAGVFFSRFKGLKEILINILKNFIDAKNLETLFPVLTILSKLEASPGYVGLDDFKPLLRSCLSVKYWKIRESASRALSSLISDKVEEAQYLWTSCSVRDQNKLHGYLLAIKELGCVNDELRSILVSRIDELLVNNRSYVTAKAYLDILNIYFADNSAKTSENDKILRAVFEKEISSYEVDGSKQLYLKALFDALVKSEEVLILSFQSDFYELKLSAINYCSDKNIDHPLLKVIVNNVDEWAYLRSKAIKLVDDISLEKAFEFVNNESLYGEDLKCSAFEFLGRAIAKNGTNYNEWCSLVKKLSDEDEPFTVRIAALKSALRYLAVKRSPEIEWVIYQFLFDDDDEIRALASSYFKAGVVPWVSALKFSESAGPGASKLASDEVLAFNPQFSIQEADNELFSIEKKNFYINNIEKSSQLIDILNRCELESSTRESINSHLSELKERLLNVLHTPNIEISWSIDQQLFEEIYITVCYLKNFGLSMIEIEAIIDNISIQRTLYRLVKA